MKYRVEVHECPRQYGYKVYDENNCVVEDECGHADEDAARQYGEAAALELQENDEV